MFVLVGFGNGLIDAAWCAWIGAMAHSHEVSGVLQACYALGATISPLIATTMISTGGLGWYAFYYIMVCLFPTNIFLILQTKRVVLNRTSKRSQFRLSNSSVQSTHFGPKQELYT